MILCFYFKKLKLKRFLVLFQVSEKTERTALLVEQLTNEKTTLETQVSRKLSKEILVVRGDLSATERCEYTLFH